MVIGQTIPEVTIPKVFESTEREVSYQVATKTTSNITGSEELNYADAVTKKIIFVRGDKRHEFGMEGLYETADAIVLARPETGMKKDDKFTVDGDVFIVQVVDEIEYREVHHFDRGIAIKI